MNQERYSSFLAAAIACFDRLSECPELKNYRIYSEPDVLSHHSLKQDAASAGNAPTPIMPARRRSGKWIVVVSAKRSGKARPLGVNVRICR